MAQEFLDSFCNKVDEIRNRISSSTTGTPADPVLPNSYLYKDLCSFLGPTMLDIVNLSLTTGIVPKRQLWLNLYFRNCTLIQGLLITIVSNLPLFSKVLVRVVSQPLSTHIKENYL